MKNIKGKIFYSMWGPMEMAKYPKLMSIRILCMEVLLQWRCGTGVIDPDKMETYRSGEVPEVINNREKVAVHYNLPTINLAKEVTERIFAGEFKWEDDFKNLYLPWYYTLATGLPDGEHILKIRITGKKIRKVKEMYVE